MPALDYHTLLINRLFCLCNNTLLSCILFLLQQTLGLWSTWTLDYFIYLPLHYFICPWLDYFTLSANTRLCYRIKLSYLTPHYFTLYCIFLHFFASYETNLFCLISRGISQKTKCSFNDYTHIVESLFWLIASITSLHVPWLA